MSQEIQDHLRQNRDVRLNYNSYNCEICGTHHNGGENDGIAGVRYDHVVIDHHFGWYMNGLAEEFNHLSIDICSKCFMGKLLPALADMGWERRIYKGGLA